jgi:hypothetical protein
VASADADGPLIGAALRAAGLEPVELRSAAPSMEDVFIERMGEAA